MIYHVNYAAYSRTSTDTGGLIVAESVLLLVLLLIVTAYVLYADRKIWAAVQIRRGPNVVGPWGLLQSFADLLKFIATTTNVGRPGAPSTGFTAPHSAKGDDQVTHLLELYTRCLEVVQGKSGAR